MKNNKAFTLIELLVVISIIGVLSSIVLVSFSGSRDKAKLARAQQFDANISHGLGAYAVGIWRFEEGSGIDIYDESGYGNDGTFVGNPSPTFPDSEVYVGTKALYFDGSDDYVNCGNGSSLNITDAITIEAWVKTTSSGYVVSRQNVSGNIQYVLAVRSPNGCFGTFDNGTWYFTNEGDITLKDDKWHHMVGTFDEALEINNLKLYVDGVLKGVKTHTAPLPSYTGWAHIGEDYDSSQRFNGSIDNVAIYDEALSSAQIQQIYAQSAASHGIAMDQ